MILGFNQHPSNGLMVPGIPPPPPPLSPYPQFSQQAHPPQFCLFPPAPRTGTPHASAAATQAAPAYMHPNFHNMNVNFSSMNGLGLGSMPANPNTVNDLGAGSSVGSPSPLASLSPLLHHPAFASRWGMPITSTVAPIMSFGPPGKHSSSCYSQPHAVHNRVCFFIHTVLWSVLRDDCFQFCMHTCKVVPHNFGDKVEVPLGVTLLLTNSPFR